LYVNKLNTKQTKNKKNLTDIMIHLFINTGPMKKKPKKRTCGNIFAKRKICSNTYGTYRCSFQQKWTLEAVKQQALLILFIQKYEYKAVTVMWLRWK